MDRSRLQGRWWGSRDGDDNMMEKEGHTGAFDHCDGVAVYDNKRRGKNQGEKILTSGKTRISNIVKINIIITSYYSPTISYKTFLKIAPNLNHHINLAPISKYTEGLVHLSDTREALCRFLLCSYHPP